ncbi:MAG: hypothetical protein ACT4PU_13425 [Planctomycetota bacterium]
MPGTNWRGLLALTLVLGGALAAAHGLLTPLWEFPGEWEQAQSVLRAARGEAPLVLTDAPPGTPVEAALPPPAHWPQAALAWALGLADIVFLARTDDAPSGRPVFRWLHGADEVWPFAGPARAAHGLRLLSALLVVLAAWGAAALARRLLPDGRGAGASVLAAALLLAAPYVSMHGASVGAGALTMALGALTLVQLLALRSDPAPTRGRCLRAGLVLGVAQASSLAAVALLPVAALALLRHPAHRAQWRGARPQLEALLLGLLLTAGPLWTYYLLNYGSPWPWAQTVARPGAALGASGLDLTSLTEWLPTLGIDLARRLSLGVFAAPWLGWLWALVLLGALAGFFRSRWVGRAQAHTAAVPQAGLGWLLLSAVVSSSLLTWLVFLWRGESQAAGLLPALPALAALCAVGLAQLSTRPALLVAAGLLLLLLTAQQLGARLVPAYAGLQRLDDPHWLCFDPLATVPPIRRLPTIAWVRPAQGSAHAKAPTLQWAGPADPAARYTVQLSTPGSLLAWGSYEKFGQALTDRWEIPAALWNSLPPKVELVCRVVRLPTSTEALAVAPGTLDVDESLPLSVRRAAD